MSVRMRTTACHTHTKGASPTTIVVAPLHQHRNHIPLVTHHLYLEWAGLYKQEGIHSMAELEQHLVKRCDHQHTLPVTLVAMIEDTLVGTVSIDKEDLPASMAYHSETPWLASLLVLPQHRGLGIAAALIDACVREARQRQFATLWLWTVKSVPLYSKYGFNIVEEVYFPVKGKNITVMNMVMSGVDDDR